MLGSEVVMVSRWSSRCGPINGDGRSPRPGRCPGPGEVGGHGIVGAVGSRVVPVRFGVSVGSVGRSRIRNEGQDDSPA